VSSSKYLVKLTWLRGVAAILVVISHCIRTAQGRYDDSHPVGIHSDFIKVFDLGTFGVVLFFALSGATLYFSNKNLALSDTLAFFVKRFFRIWPAFAVALIVYALFRFIFQIYYSKTYGNWIEYQFLQSFGYIDVLTYLTLSFNLIGEVGLFNNAFWSLPVEFQYYLFFPFLLFLTRTVGIITPIFLSIIAYACQKYNLITLASNDVLLLAFTFFLGFLLAHIHNESTFRMSWKCSFFLFASFCLACSAVTNDIISFSGVPFISNQAVYSGIFALGAVFSLLFMNADFEENAFAVRPIYWLGEVSYSLYLYHNLILGILVIVMLNINCSDSLKNPWINLIVVLPTTCIIAKLSYRFIEKPSIELGRKIAKKRER
tara:strand:+ start:5858 stop:6979 length:1122 start_codon:yes stop_codon:yes gene_type:complete